MTSFNIIITYSIPWPRTVQAWPCKQSKSGNQSLEIRNWNWTPPNLLYYLSDNVSIQFWPTRRNLSTTRENLRALINWIYLMLFPELKRRRKKEKDWNYVIRDWNSFESQLIWALISRAIFECLLENVTYRSDR